MNNDYSYGVEIMDNNQVEKIIRNVNANFSIN